MGAGQQTEAGGAIQVPSAVLWGNDLSPRDNYSFEILIESGDNRLSDQDKATVPAIMSDRFIGKVIADKYRIVSHLGESRSGSLFLGKHLLIGNPVTVKVLDRGEGFDEDAAARFSAEARSVSKIAHPNILNITDFGQDIDGTIYAILEDASGEPLKERIEREGQMAVNTAVRVARQVGSALTAAHSRDLAHGSLTSEKVILAPIGEGSELVKVFDVGALRLSPEGTGGLTDDELAYAAPELFGEGAKPGERSDVYSLGVLLYEILAGERPFSGDAFELRSKHLQVPPPPLVAFRNDLPEGLEAAILAAMAKDPSKRTPSVSTFVDALNEAVADDGADDALAVPAASGVTEGNNLWKTAFIVLAGIAVLAFGLIYWTSVKQTNPATTLSTDTNSQPVQPLNPATGLGERTGLNSAPAVLAGDPDAIPEDIGGDGYDPWASPGAPPPGQQAPVGPGGDYVTIPGDGSIFMPGDGGVILVPKIVPAKTPEATGSASPTPTNPPASGNTNTQPQRPAATPAQPGITPAQRPKPEGQPPSAGNGEKAGPADGDS